MPDRTSKHRTGARKETGNQTRVRDGKRVTVVLGPTNTGKTHLALERMTGYASGVIGFPLRLLARENYDRLVQRLGAGRVGLITGEERIVPPGARYLCCTVESMPTGGGDAGAPAAEGREFEFVAVDEVQLAGDRERGHVFTDRILNLRGVHETMFMGAETAGPLLRKLLPGARFETRERMSRLGFSGAQKLTRLPRRSAIVAFGADDVYRIAEFVRSQRGGAAVVMGRLSPRTRNAQVDLYQNGDVDFLVATDAIGMGLNLDLGHVALARDSKFDGRQLRRLLPAEMAQIAGRAGRHTNDGTFGMTDGCPPPLPHEIDAIERHRFDALKSFWWRSGALDFASVEALLASLDAPPPRAFLLRKSDALDHKALVALCEREEVREMARGRDEVRLLWEVASIPDFRQATSDNHHELIAGIYLQLAGRGRLGEEAVARAMDALDRLDGDIDTLMTRLAYIRTWTYIANRDEWTDDPARWQRRAMSIEDRLSDRLHDRLSEMFVDRRAAHLSRKLTQTGNLMAVVKNDGTVLVEGEEVGVLDGFVFRPHEARGEGKSTLVAAARRGLPDEIENRVRALASSDTAAFRPDANGWVAWREARVARLVSSGGLYAPRPELVDSDLLSSEQRQRILARLSEFVADHVRQVLGGLMALESAESAPDRVRKADLRAARKSVVPTRDAGARDAGAGDAKVAGNANGAGDANGVDNARGVDEAKGADDARGVVAEAGGGDGDGGGSDAAAPLSGAAKGIAYQMFEGLGTVPTSRCWQQIAELEDNDRKRLGRLGIRFGVESVYMPDMLKPASIALRALLWNLHNAKPGAFQDAPGDGRVTPSMAKDVPDGFLVAVGYRRLGELVMRVDMVERVAHVVREAARGGKFEISDDMLSLAGATREQMRAMLFSLHYHVVETREQDDKDKPAIEVFERKPRRAEKRGAGRGAPGRAGSGSGKRADRAGADGRGRGNGRSGGTRADASGATSDGRSAQRGKPGRDGQREAGEGGADRRGAGRAGSGKGGSGKAGAGRSGPGKGGSGKVGAGTGGPGKGGSGKGGAVRYQDKSRQPEADSPFAVLAALKLKS